MSSGRSWGTDRLRLEPMGPQHVDDLVALHADEAVAVWHDGSAGKGLARYALLEARRRANKVTAMLAPAGRHVTRVSATVTSGAEP